MNLENVASVLRKIDDAVNGVLENQLSRERLKPEEALDDHWKRFIKQDGSDRPPATFVDSEWFPHGSVWDQALDIAWRLCEASEAFYVAHDKESHQKVTATNFGEPPRSVRLSNGYFNIATGKTIRGGFDVAGKRRGDVGEDVFLRTNGLDDLIDAIRSGRPNSFFEDPELRNASVALSPPNLRRRDFQKYPNWSNVPLEDFKKGSAREKELARIIVEELDSGKLQKPYREAAMKLCPDLFKKGNRSSRAFDRAYATAAESRPQLSKPGAPKI